MLITIALGSGIECVVGIKLISKLLNINFLSRFISSKVNPSTLLNSFSRFSIRNFANLLAYTGHLILFAKNATAPA